MWKRKIPISPGLVFIKKAFLLSEACPRMEFYASKWVGLDNKNSFKHQDNSLKQLSLTFFGFIIGRIFEVEIWGADVRERECLAEFYDGFNTNKKTLAKADVELIQSRKLFVFWNISSLLFYVQQKY